VARLVATGLVAARLTAARLIAFDDLVLALGLRLSGSTLCGVGLRRLGAGWAAAAAAAATAASRRLGAFDRGLGDWIHAVTLFLGEPGIVTRHVALRPVRVVLRRAGVGCGFAW
jgi:hypothetical protein